MEPQTVLAAVDLGSNSFRLQMARVVDGHLYMLDGLRESVRLAAGLSPDEYLDEAAQQRALSCLKLFNERLRGLPNAAVRAVATNTLRVAKNADDFLPRAEAVLGFPIEVIAGREEARLIYVGVAQGLPPSQERRLVVDIGGGSTEIIIGCGLDPKRLESLYMGCVSYAQRYFRDGKIKKSNFKQAELAARNELQSVLKDFSPDSWDSALGSSGTARMMHDILLQNGYSSDGITRAGMDRLREHLLEVGNIKKLSLLGIKPDRLEVLPSGFAILYAIFCELGIKQMRSAEGALREGVLCDLVGRRSKQDARDVTVRQFMQRYQVNQDQAERVVQLSRRLAQDFLRQLTPPATGDEPLQILEWAARLHEVGISIAHNGYHKHTAYILGNADMPGFAKNSQALLGRLTLAQRGGLEKVRGILNSQQETVLAMALRLAILFCRNRRQTVVPVMRGGYRKNTFTISLPAGWLTENPLTEASLAAEMQRWKSFGVKLRIA